MDGDVAVLGATGYLGRTLVAALLAAGRQVVMIARRPPVAVPHGARFIQCNARDAASLGMGLRHVDQAVNATTGSPTAIAQVAMNLAAWASGAAAGPRLCLVHVSSLAVFGQCDGVLDELTTPLPTPRHSYAAAKRCAEKILQNDPIVAASCAILRPGCIYGADSPVWSGRIARLLLNGRLGWLGPGGRGWCHVVHVSDVAAAVISALSATADMAGIHHVMAPHALTWNEYFRSFGAHLGLQSLARITWPKLAAETWLAAPLTQAATRISGAPADMITPSMRRLFRNRALAVSVRPPLLPSAAFRTLSTGLADAAQAALSDNASSSARLLRCHSALATVA